MKNRLVVQRTAASCVQPPWNVRQLHVCYHRPPMVLTTKQRQFLKGLAHPLAPVVHVGKARISAALVAETKRSLEAHELIKVRIEVDEGAARRELAAELAQQTDSMLAGTIGKLAILYRARSERPKIKLP